MYDVCKSVFRALRVSTIIAYCTPTDCPVEPHKVAWVYRVDLKQYYLQDDIWGNEHQRISVDMVGCGGCSRAKLVKMN